MRKMYLFNVVMAMIMTSIIACDILPNKNEDCEAKRWDEEVEVVVSPKFFVYATNIDENHPLSAAVKIQFSGSIQKVLCSGDSGFKTAFTSAFSGNQLSLYVYQSFDGQQSKFFFENDEEHLNVIWRVKVYFNDGSVFETDEMIQNVYFKDLFALNLSSYNKYFELYLQDSKWVNVSQ